MDASAWLLRFPFDLDLHVCLDNNSPTCQFHTMESLRSSWEHENLWMLIAATIVVAFLVQQQMAKTRQPAAAETQADTSSRTREIRLQRRLQFEDIPDDLDLQLEEPADDNAVSKDEELLPQLQTQVETAVLVDATGADTLAKTHTNLKMKEEDNAETEEDEIEAEPANEDSANGADGGSFTQETRPKTTRAQKIRQRLATAAEIRLQSQTPPFFLSDHEHTGLAAFWRWCDVEASLFRIYTVTRKDNVEDETTTAPYNPSSRRGNVPIKLRVTNDLAHPITVYWVDFKGNHVERGTISPNGGTWRQTTWIDHPWIFCATDETGEEKILMHYFPCRVIPTTAEAPTVDNDGEPDSGTTGIHQFRIAASAADSPLSCVVDDPILPYPAAVFLRTSHQAAEFSLLHCLRMNYGGWSVLKKYLSKIQQQPDNPHYRQIRIANRTFADAVWDTPAKGVLLAAGFVEHGAYAELGSDTALSTEIVKELYLLLYVIDRWELRSEGPHAQLRQPEGADGYGRAGFGR